MKKAIIVLVLLLGSASSSFADEFVVKSFEEDINDLSARVYPRLDVNDDPCAIIKIRTDLKDLIFETNQGIEGDIVEKTGEYWLYVSPGEKQLRISKEGFIKLDYTIPLPIKSNTVYIMVLTKKAKAGMEIDKDLFQVGFSINESDVFISKDGAAPIKAKGKIAVYKLPEGQYEFKFTKEGFTDQTMQIKVEKDQNIPVEMKPGQSEERFKLPGVVIIDSDPQGAEIFINDQKVAETPHTQDLIAGEYTLVLRKKLYYTSTSNFTLEEGETKQIPTLTLKPRFAYYAIETTPSDAKVYMDGKTIGNAPIARTQIESGSYALRIEKERYHTKERTVELKDGDDETFVFELVPTFGALTIAARPEQGTTIYINGVEAKANPYSNPQQPSGTYRIKVENAFYHSQERVVELKDGGRESLTFDLKPAFGELTIHTTPENAQVYLNNASIGRSPMAKRRIKSGSYSIRVERELYHSEEQRVDIKDGDDRELTLTLDPAFGELVIDSEPEKGATVFMDGIEVGKTPYRNTAQPSAIYSVRVEKDMWLGSEEDVTVSDGRITKKTFVLMKNFGSLTVLSEGSTIYLDGKDVGKDRFSRNLFPGKYALRAAKDRHQDDEREVFLRVGDKEEITLEPTPRLGSVSIISTPPESKGAEIFVNGSKQDKTSPAVLALLMGEYTVTLKHPKFLDSSQRVSLAEREQKKLIFAMQTYAGSMQQKASRWGTQKWIGFVSGVALLGAGVYCNVTADGYYDDYLAARDIEAARDARDGAERFDRYRNYSYSVSVVPLVYGIYSWAKQSHYSGKSR